ncbi:MAG: hypothetical protein RMZ43_004715 [Nostoc sp. CmiVER01]|uniref:hypothetical protein n=1 Tax=Nostoc sp. CmiVER01 TaxID=3075384 RepID=UPI002AD1EB09|nr:hypothetical protein [Nostoc sp. CmiVER01]MDZ8124411.1 hypothetical protein [Nostoc sp. CmiVER01]
MATITISDLSQELQDNSLLSELSPEEIAAISGSGLLGRIVGGVVGGVIGFVTGGPGGILPGALAGAKVGDYIEDGNTSHASGGGGGGRSGHATYAMM